MWINWLPLKCSEINIKVDADMLAQQLAGIQLARHPGPWAW